MRAILDPNYQKFKIVQGDLSVTMNYFRKRISQCKNSEGHHLSFLVFVIQSQEKKSGQRVFCRYNKKVSTKDFLDADDINKMKVSI